MKLNLENKKVLVTAATYGLGYACAQALVEEGAQVLVCSRSQDNVESTILKLRANSQTRVEGLAVDLSDPGELQRLIEWVHQTVGSLDVLVFNTGHPPLASIATAVAQDWQRGMELIINPAAKLAQAFLPAMRSRKYGRLIFISSIYGLEPESSSIIQSSLRSALNAISKCVATEAAIDGVTSNVICPGFFDTPLVQNLAAQIAQTQQRAVDDIWQSWKDLAPSKKFGKPEDLGAMVSFLASPRGEFINGSALTIDGGALKRF